MIAVEPLESPAGDAAWDDFLSASQGGLVYHCTRYRDLIAEHLGCEPEYLIAREGDEIRGVLPMMWAGEKGQRVCNSLPFYGSHGSPVAATPEAAAALIEAWNERARDPGTLSATMVANPFLDEAPPEPVHTLTDERIGQVTPLPSAEPDALMELFAKKGRRDVRRAERLGVEVELDHSKLGDVCRIHQENIRAVGGLPKSDSFFEAVPRHLRPGEDFDVWVGLREGVMIAGLLTFYFNKVAEFFTPAVELEHRADGPMGPILLRAMSEAANRGCRLWNWGGTWRTQDGVFRFKRKFGAEERPYRYFIQLNDESLLDSTPERLRERFKDFYVAPFSALRAGVSQ